MNIQINETTKEVTAAVACVAASLAAAGAFGLGVGAVIATRKSALGQVVLGGLALVGAVFATAAVAESAEATVDRILSPLVIEETTSEEGITA